MYIYPELQGPFAMAGIWGTWRSAEGEAMRSCAIVNTAANSFMAELKELLVPYPSHEMEAHEVSPPVNSVNYDSLQWI